jgi:hypothetical protein
MQYMILEVEILLLCGAQQVALNRSRSPSHFAFDYRGLRKAIEAFSFTVPLAVKGVSWVRCPRVKTIPVKIRIETSKQTDSTRTHANERNTEKYS